MAGSIDKKVTLMTVVIIVLLSLPLVYYLSANFIFVPPIVGIWRGSIVYNNATDTRINAVVSFSKDGNGTISVFQEVLDSDNYVARQIDTPITWAQKDDAYYVDYGVDTIRVYLQNNNEQLYLPDNTENGTPSPYRGWLKRDSS